MSTLYQTINLRRTNRKVGFLHLQIAEIFRTRLDEPPRQEPHLGVRMQADVHDELVALLRLKILLDFKERRCLIERYLLKHEISQSPCFRLTERLVPGISG